MDSELKSTDTRLADAETRLPNSGAMDQFITPLSQVAEEAGLKVNIINPKPVEQGENYRVMPIEISRQWFLRNPVVQIPHRPSSYEPPHAA